MHKIVAEQITGRIEVEGLVKRFGAMTAVDGVSLKVNPASSWRCWAHRVRGKTTILMAIAGFEYPDVGRI